MAKEQIIDIQTGKVTDQENDSIKVEKRTLAKTLPFLRMTRNGILSQSDWMANSDVTMSEEWKTYRQELRDITKGITTVAQVDEKLKKDDNGVFINFPTAPSE